MSNTGSNSASPDINKSKKSGHTPFWFLAELTYACPLQCPYCSNPINYADTRKHELSTEEWKSVLRQARALGAVQLGFSGGEPCVRQDLEELVKEAHALGFYTNLITSTVGLNTERILALKEAGLDHIQVSYQGADGKTNDTFAGTQCFDHKLEMTKVINDLNFPVVHNFVLHRHNIHQVKDMLEMALSLGAESVELANCQYHGWALKNIAALLPSAQQLKEAEAVVNVFREQHGEKMKIFFVVPDLYETRPRACTNGWATTLLSVTPDGRVLPCQGAQDFPETIVPNIRENALNWIWHESPMFNQYRGDDWMSEPCRSCPEKEKDFGGCRCQAFQLTGDPSRTDPVCDKSPDHDIVLALQDTARTSDLIMRTPKGHLKPHRINVIASDG